MTELNRPVLPAKEEHTGYRHVRDRERLGPSGFKKGNDVPSAGVEPANLLSPLGEGRTGFGRHMVSRMAATHQY